MLNTHTHTHAMCTGKYSMVGMLPLLLWCYLLMLVAECLCDLFRYFVWENCSSFLFEQTKGQEKTENAEKTQRFFEITANGKAKAKAKAKYYVCAMCVFTIECNNRRNYSLNAEVLCRLCATYNDPLNAYQLLFNVLFDLILPIWFFI